MQQAENGNSRKFIESAPGKSGDHTALSRRRLLSVGAVLPLAIVAPAAIAGVVADDERDFIFAYAKWKSVSDEVENGVYDNIPARLAKREDIAFAAMMAVPVATARAVLMKYEASSALERNRAGRFATADLISWDLERVAKKEMFA